LAKLWGIRREKRTGRERYRGIEKEEFALKITYTCINVYAMFSNTYITSVENSGDSLWQRERCTHIHIYKYILWLLSCNKVLRQRFGKICPVCVWEREKHKHTHIIWRIFGDNYNTTGEKICCMYERKIHVHIYHLTRYLSKL